MPAMQELSHKYHKLGAQLADISLVHLASREELTTVFTLDRRDFSVFRGPGNQSFLLLPLG
jgi:predicted nucleic acid-binding protein